MKPRTARAFTLIELLVALSVAAVILAITYGTCTGTIDSVARCRARATAEDEARAALRLILRDLRCACIPPSSLREHDAPPPAFHGDPSSVCFATFLPAADPRNATPGIGYVHYRLDTFRCRLLRGTSPTPESPGEWLPVADNVHSIDFEYFDAGSWSRSWNSADSSLPSAIRVTVAVGPATCIAAARVAAERSPAALRRTLAITPCKEDRP